MAAAPISWGICDVEGWGHQLPCERVLAEMASCGVTATEAGPDGFLPRDPVAARNLVAENGLAVVGGFVGLVLHRGLAAWRAELVDALAKLRALGAEWILLAALEAPGTYERRPELGPEQWAELLRTLDAATEVAGEHGLRMAVHPHLATVLERPDDVRRVLDGSAAMLCLDTGHYTVGGGDPAALAREAANRIGYVHLKDVDERLAEAVRAGRLGFLGAVREGLFCPLGRGDVDVAAAIRALVDAGYSGWMVLEQDVMLDASPAPGTGPVRDVRDSVGYVRPLVGD